MTISSISRIHAPHPTTSPPTPTATQSILKSLDITSNLLFVQRHIGGLGRHWWNMNINLCLLNSYEHTCTNVVGWGSRVYGVWTSCCAKTRFSVLDILWMNLGVVWIYICTLTWAALSSRPFSNLSKILSHAWKACVKFHWVATSPTVEVAFRLFIACRDAMNVVINGSKSLIKRFFRAARRSSTYVSCRIRW